MAKRRQPAALRKYWASKHKRKSHSKRKVSYVTRSHNPKRRHHRHRRRNPMGLGSFSGLTNKIMPALIGGGGALAVDLLFQKTPIATYLPASLTTGYLKYVTRAAGVLAIAFVVGKVKPSWKGEVLAGGLSVVAYSLLKDLANNVGHLALADYDDVPDYSTLGYMSPGAQLGAYMQNYPAVQNAPRAPTQTMGAYVLDDYNTANLD